MVIRRITSSNTCEHSYSTAREAVTNTVCVRLAADCVDLERMHVISFHTKFMPFMFYVYVLDPSLPALSGGTAIQNHRRSDYTDQQ